MNFLKNNFALAIITLMIATASCSFTNTVDPGDKDKEELLINLIYHVLQKNHYAPADLTDAFSEDVYKNFIADLDGSKRYFLEADIKEFDTYKFLLDDQIRDSEIGFFNLVYERFLKRQEESEKIFTELIDTPFDFSKNESLNTDYDKMEYAANRAALKDHWRKLLKLSTLNIYYDKVADQEESDEEKKTLTALEKEARMEVKKSMLENFDVNDDVERLDYYSVYVNAITAHFDPHTNYFAPRTKDRFDTSMSGQLEGIGARLQKKMDYIKILELISGGPAWRSEQLEVGDVILKVAQENDTIATSIVGMRISDAVELIKGPKGTKVILTLKKVDGNIEDITLTRDIVEIEETFAKALKVTDDNINYGLINLPKFYFNMDNKDGRASGKDIAIEIERLKEEGATGLILDLRNNGGGSLREVVDMVGHFISSGPVVQVALKNQNIQTLRDRDGGAVLWDGPLVIMVNELSASASEILAAALQDYDRAVVVGSKQTFGKGTVQNVEDLNRFIRNSDYGDLGALKLTTQKFYRINGASTQLEGVKSDVVIPGRYSYIDVGERDEEYPLAYDEIPAATYKKFNGYLNLDAVISNSQARVNGNKYFNLIDKSARWASEQRDDYEYPLNYEAYKARLDRIDEETARYDDLDDYSNDLSFSLLNHELLKVEQDSALKQKRERWMESLNNDIYVEEAVNVLKELKLNAIQYSNRTIKD